MARRLLLPSALALALIVPLSMERSRVEAGPKTPPPPAACKDQVSKLNKDLAAAIEAQRRAEAGEAQARAELEQMKEAERARQKKLEAQTGVAADKLR